MKVLIFTNHFWPENFRINDLALGLVEKGHEVTVISSIPNYPEGKYFPGYGVFKKRWENYRGINIRRIPIIPRGNGSSIRLFINYISSAVSFCLHAPFVGRKKYDVIFIFETSPATIGLPAVIVKWLYRIPIVLWVLDLWPESLSATGAVKNKGILAVIKQSIRLIYSNSDRVLVSSRGFKQSIEAIGGYRGTIDYFPNWVEPEIVSPNGCQAPKIELPNGFRILFTGNVGAAQDFESIIASADMLRNHQDIHWLIVGNGRMMDWVREEVEKRGLEKQFHLLGRYPLESMSYFYSVADALLLPLRKDPIFELTAPGKLQSYMSAGLPILAALDGEGANIVSEAGCGVVCNASDPASLTAGILSLVQMSATERQEMGRAGAKFCSTHFCRETLFDELERTLLTISGRENCSKNLR